MGREENDACSSASDTNQKFASQHFGQSPHRHVDSMPRLRRAAWWPRNAEVVVEKAVLGAL